MPFSCPHCTKEIPGAVSEESFKERLEKLTTQRKEWEAKAAKAEERATLAEGVAAQTVPLAAKMAGYDADGDTLEILQARYGKAQAAGYQGSVVDWLGDAEKGAGIDPTAARFRASPAPAPAPGGAPAPAPPPAGKLPSAPAPAPPRLSGAMTAEQVAAANRPLIEARAQALRTGNKADADRLMGEINANRAKIGPPAT